LAEKHGTPEQFEKAIQRAWDDLFITSYEADAAFKKYRAEWDAAGTGICTSNAPAEARRSRSLQPDVGQEVTP
jgi:hypothetical protein